MRCEQAKGCGFYKYMESLGRAEDGDCGKANKNDCPRRIEKTAGLSFQQRQIHKLAPGEKMYTQELPMTHEEISLAYPDGL